MSDLKQLKGRLDQIGREAKSTAANLSGFSGRFSQQAGEVEQAIGGTATQVDKQMMETLQAAEKQVAEAIAALQQVADTAAKYGASL